MEEGGSLQGRRHVEPWEQWRLGLEGTRIQAGAGLVRPGPSPRLMTGNQWGQRQRDSQTGTEGVLWWLQSGLHTQPAGAGPGQ